MTKGSGRDQLLCVTGRGRESRDHLEATVIEMEIFIDYKAGICQEVIFTPWC